MSKRGFKFDEMKAHTLTNEEIVMKQQKYIDEIKIFFSKTSGLISRRLGTKHPWVKGIQVCSVKGHTLFQDKYTEIITKKQIYINEI